MRATVKGVSRREQKKWIRGEWCAFMNGEDVTNRCFYADDRRGVVRLYHEDSDGHKLSGAVFRLDAPPAGGRRLANDWNGPLTVELHGKVRLERVRA